MKQIKYFFSHIRYLLSNLWHLVLVGRYKTPKEKLFEAARKQGYTSVHKVPERYRGKKKYKKAPKIIS